MQVALAGSPFPIEVHFPCSAAPRLMRAFDCSLVCREDLVSSYLCKRPTAGTAAGLAAKLKWLLQTVGVGLPLLVPPAGRLGTVCCAWQSDSGAAAP